MNLYTEKISEFLLKLFKKNKKEENNNNNNNNNLEDQEEEYAAKILSPTQMVLKRFFRSKLSVIGLSMIIGLFLFSFVGPLFSPYEELEADTDSSQISIIPTTIEVIVQKDDIYDVQFMNDSYIYQDISLSRHNNYIRLKIATTKAEDFKIVLYGDNIQKEYNLTTNGKEEELVFDISGLSIIEKSHVEKIYIYGTSSSSIQIIEVKALNDTFIDGTINFVDGTFIEQSDSSSEIWKGEFAAIDITKGEKITNTTYNVTFSEQKTNRLAYPSWKHWLGTDSSGYDILTRCMYGGRISLKIAFIVVLLETFIGVIFGCLAGYFGKWVDMVIMRIVDIFYCVPTIPILMIVSAVLTQNNVDESVRIYYMMVFMCLLGWSGTARMVRGQILMLREQEYMTAARAMGLSIPRQIVKHLIPNVMPQLIVSMTLGLGSVILTESTLSFLGIGVPVPYAAWGTMISGLQKTEILNNHFHAWGPPGFCIMIVVLGFNFVGDGLRDAFDPKSKR